MNRATKWGQATAARAANAIRERAGFRTLVLPVFDNDAINAVLSRSLLSLEAEAAERVRDHLRKLGEGGEAWVANGVPRITAASAGSEGEVCPFCAQDLQGSPVIRYYQAYFSDAYASLKADIRAMGQGVAAEHGGDVPAGFERSIREAVENRDFWKNFIEVSEIGIDTAAVVRAWTAAREAVLSVLRAKAAAPLDAMELPDEVRKVISDYDETQRSTVTALSDALQACNNPINLVKEQAAAADLSSLQANLVRNKAIKARFEPGVAALCDDYLTEKKEKVDTEAKRDAARKALDNYREEIFPAYEIAINAYLTKFGAGFHLSSVDSVNTRGGSAVSYNVVISNQPVSLMAAEGPSFRNTLSAGDRNALALAFFFASLTQDPALADKIVVIDDPMTSLDEHRSLTTMEVMRALCEDVSQVIVLSHSKSFLCDLWAGADKNGRSSMRIIRGETGSELAPWDVSSDAVTEHDRRHTLVASYIQAADPSNERQAAMALRPILERFMRVACPSHFPPSALLGPFLAECTQKLGTPSQILSSSNVNELRQLLTYANRFHHDTNPAWQTVAINDAELLNYATRTLRFASRN